MENAQRHVIVVVFTNNQIMFRMQSSELLDLNYI